jgi:DNA-binding helix-hairpin-helix protein with protein kinase domain
MAPQPPATLSLSSGGTVTLDQRVGGGGEGTVYRVRERPDAAAKIYLVPMSRERRAKIEAMIAASPPRVTPFTAWPTALLLERTEAVGFLMPLVKGASEVHVVYGLKSRKQKYPTAGYRFLVHVATNLARAFAQLHASGIVVGDINERAAMIGADGTARIIDCDSFQYRATNVLHRCEVGTPIFTPPELQTVASFRTIERTAAHDNFGLAVLLFHLLFLGRHPFSGQCRQTNDMPIEKAIQEHRFAYSADRHRTDMVQPPHTPPLDYSGRGLAGLFERAFAQAAASGHHPRPTAGQWVDALKAFQSQLATCKQNASHAFVPANGPCPWCAIELTTSIDLLNYVEPSGGTTSSIDYEAIWRAIGGALPPIPRKPPDPSQLKASQAPSAEALLILRFRSEQKAISSARAELTMAATHLADQEAQLSQLKSVAEKAHAHVAAFDSDGLRLLALNQEHTANDKAIERYGRYNRLLRWAVLPAAVAAVAATGAMVASTVPVGMAVLATIATLRNSSTRKRRKVQLTNELNSLLASINLGVDHRRKLAATADLAVDEVNGRVTQAKLLHGAASAAEQVALRSATVSESRSQSALSSIRQRYKDTRQRLEALSTHVRALESELTKARQNMHERKQAARAVYEAIRSLENQREAARLKAQHDERQLQLETYLDQFFIAQETWSRIPKSAIAALSSYGIETAADINRADVIKVPGFGEVRTGMLLDWRMRKSSGFRFDPNQGGLPQQLQQVQRRISAQRHEQERSLSRIKAQFDAIVAGPSHQIAQYEQLANEVALNLARTLRDSDVLELRLASASIPYPTVTAATRLQPAQFSTTIAPPKRSSTPPPTRSTTYRAPPKTRRKGRRRKWKKRP